MADDELKGDEGELQGNSEFLPFQKADNDDDAPDTVEVVALDAEPTVEDPTTGERKAKPGYEALAAAAKAGALDAVVVKAADASVATTSTTTAAQESAIEGRA